MTNVHPPKRRRALATALAVALTSLGAVSVAGTAQAAPQSATLNLAFTGTTEKTLLDEQGVCDNCVPDIMFNDESRTGEEFGLGAHVMVASHLEWQALATNTVSYNDSLLRQGQTLDTKNAMTSTLGVVDVDFTVDYEFGLYMQHTDFGPAGCSYDEDLPNTCNWVPTSETVEGSKRLLGASIPCAMPLPGQGEVQCESGTISLPIINLEVVPGVGASLALQFTLVVSVDSTGMVSVRKAEVLGGMPIADQSLSFVNPAPATVSDPLMVACGQPVGNDLSYALTDNKYDADVDLGLQIALVLEVEALGIGTGWELASRNFPLVTYPPITMTAPDVSTILGPVQVDNVAPVANAGGPYGGSEGSAITFDGTASTDNCGMPTLRWDFSDGGVAFGPTPQHTFRDNGTYTGLLTATDAAGNSSSTTFVVTVQNVAPIANAGPDTTVLWGTAVVFNGQAFDAGVADRSTLQATWSFGDGSPSATGGLATTHIYAAPGTYVATLTVTDKDGGQHSDTRTIHVAQRGTTLAYNGAVQAKPNSSTTVKANVVDELGQPVAGRTVNFTVGTQQVSAVTDGTGTAVGAFKVNQKTGNYTVTASFAGDAKYGSSSDSAAYRIAGK